MDIYKILVMGPVFIPQIALELSKKWYNMKISKLTLHNGFHGSGLFHKISTSITALV
jgi:hypothetical protein